MALERKITRRQALGGLAATGVWLVGCGAGQGPAASAAPSVAATAASSGAATPKGLIPPPVKASSPITISYWHWAGPHVNVQKQLGEKYKSLYDPNVTLEPTAYPSANDGRAAIRAALLSGGGPDIFSSLPGSDLVSYVQSKQAASYTAAFNADPSWKDSFLPLINAMQTVNGEIWSVTAVGNTVGLYYNEGLLSKNGVKPPTTIDELKAAGQALRAAGLIPVAYPAGQAADFPEYLYTLLVGALDGANTMRQADLGKAPWTSRELVQAMELYRDLVSAQIFPPGVAGLKEPDAIALFATGKAAMYLSGIWARTSIEPAVPPGTVVRYQPFVAAKAGGTRPVLGGLGQNMMVNPNSKNRDIAFQMVRWLTGNPGRVTYAAGIGFPPSGTVPSESQSELDKVMTTPAAQDVLKVQTLSNTPRGVYTPEVDRALSEACQSILAGRGDPATLMAQVEEASKKVGTRTFDLPPLKF